MFTGKGNKTAQVPLLKKVFLLGCKIYLSRMKAGAGTPAVDTPYIYKSAKPKPSDGSAINLDALASALAFKFGSTPASLAGSSTPMAGILTPGTPGSLFGSAKFTPKSFNKNIPIFSGDDALSFVDWLDRFEECAAMECWGEEDKCAMALKLSVWGTALAKLWDVLGASINKVSWEVLIATLRNTFVLESDLQKSV